MSRDDLRWMVIASALPIILCASRLNLALWSDEVYTLLHFARQGVLGIVTDYSLPNNHILYTLIIRPVFLLSADELVLRLPSLVFAIGSLLLTYLLALRLLGRSAAVWSTLALGLNVMFLVHVMQVRGYGLSILLVCALANLAAMPLDSPAKSRRQATSSRGVGLGWRELAIVLSGAGFLYTIPTNAMFLAPLSVWAVWRAKYATETPGPWMREALVWGGAWVIGLSLYLPIWSQVIAHRTPASSVEVVRLAGWVYGAALRDLWPIWLLLPVSVGVWWFRTRSTMRMERWSVPVLATLMIVGPPAACVPIGTAPFVRNFSPMLPFIAIATAWLMQESAAAIKSARGGRWREEATTLGGAVLLVTLLLPASFLYPSRLERYRREQYAQDGYFNYYAARFDPACVAAQLRERIDPTATYLICYADRDHYDLVYYLSRAGFPIPPYHVAASVERGPLYVVLPALPDFQGLAERCGISQQELTEFEQVADCGYFRVLRAPEQRVLAEDE